MMLRVEQRTDTEAGAVGRDAADPDDRRAPEHREADVVDHLARAQLEDADACGRPRPRPRPLRYG